MNNRRLYHSKNGVAPKEARTDQRLGKKNRIRRSEVIEQHLATDYSQAPAAIALRLKKVKPVVEGDTLCVDTELGLFTLTEFMEVVSTLPSPEKIRQETQKIHEVRQFEEDQPVYPDFTKQVVVKLTQGTSRRGDDY